MGIFGFAGSSAYDAWRSQALMIVEDERPLLALAEEMLAELACEFRRVAPGVPIVLMSGYVGAQLAQRAAAIGINDVLRKPLQRRDLAESLARVMGSAP